MVPYQGWGWLPLLTDWALGRSQWREGYVVNYTFTPSLSPCPLCSWIPWPNAGVAQERGWLTSTGQIPSPPDHWEASPSWGLLVNKVLLHSGLTLKSLSAYLLFRSLCLPSSSLFQSPDHPGKPLFARCQWMSIEPQLRPTLLPELTMRYAT